MIGLDLWCSALENNLHSYEKRNIDYPRSLTNVHSPMSDICCQLTPLPLVITSQDLYACLNVIFFPSSGGNVRCADKYHSQDEKNEVYKSLIDGNPMAEISCGLNKDR